MKVTLENFRKIQEYKKLGLSQKKTATNLSLTLSSVRKWWDLTEEDLLNAENTRAEYLDNYKEFMLSQLHTCPQIKVTNLYFKLKETFHDFECSRAPFYKYVQKLRYDYGYDYYTGRQTTPRKPLPPGYEAQVDFGQFKMKDMYDRTTRVYFFCMVLSYSRMHFVYFHPEPFTTETAIRAHEYAFRYFGGRPQTIMYDQDRVFVVSENLGNIIFVPEFEEYVNTVGYSIVLCRPRDPQTKGKVENFVKYVKENFLEGRIFAGIDSLNSAALHWLDVEANGTYNYSTKRIPREEFMTEAPTLVKVPFRGNLANNFRNVSPNYCVTYQGSRYLLPKEKVHVKEVVRIEEDEGQLAFYRAADNVLILENAVKIAQLAKKCIVRVPTIPGFNDTPEEIRDIARFAAQQMRVEEINLLPYHRLGTDKYAGIGREYLMGDILPPTEEHMEMLKKVCEEEGLRAKIGG